MYGNFPYKFSNEYVFFYFIFFRRWWYGIDYCIGLHTNPTFKHKLHGDVGLNTTFCCFVTIIFWYLVIGHQSQHWNIGCQCWFVSYKANIEHKAHIENNWLSKLLVCIQTPFFSSHVVMWDWTQDWRLYCQCCFVTICFWYLVMGHHCQHETLTSALVHVVQSQHWTPLVEQVKFEHEADCFKLAEPKRVPQSMCVWSNI